MPSGAGGGAGILSLVAMISHDCDDQDSFCIASGDGKHGLTICHEFTVRSLLGGAQVARRRRDVSLVFEFRSCPLFSS